MSAEPMSVQTPPPSSAGWKLWLPLLLFTGFLALVVHGLIRPGSSEVESAMIGKPVPAFSLPAASPDRPGLASADLASGKPRLLNIFASWCIPCAIEAPQLEALRREGHAIDGIAIRDRSEDLAAFLARHGNPFARIGKDDVSQVQMALGSSGVPESFVIDGKGVIRYQHIGVIRAADLPLLRAKLREAAQ
jgi:cytochrome c biogenesis protein CcmG, thiol:disulfide interchange protein DsbE